ncbi:MAG: diaminopimelate decarboxylase [Clostridia bacterium]|nr:diaminopimelate decarboxylase [Clostridia bacterium]
MICENIGVKDNHLSFAGVDTVALAEKYGTPLYIMDEDRIRHNCRAYMKAMKEHFGENSFPAYASKAASFKRIYEIMKEEGMGIDLVSLGEIFTAHKAGFPMEKSFFHGNNKTFDDVDNAKAYGVGYFVADNISELDLIGLRSRSDEQSGLPAKKQKVILRLTPGIDPHTYDAVATGKVDSKFGTAIETGQAEQLVKKALEKEYIDIVGYHCHVGSQVFDSEGDVYLNAATIMLNFGAEMQKKYGVEFKVLNLGGGFGVRYTQDDPYLDIEANIAKLGKHIKATCKSLGIDVPQIIMEPGRSIVADAGMTLYSAGTIKEITGYKNYVSVDGGMTDNPRYALYGSKYTVLLANRMNEKADFTADVVGRCCESGDIIQPSVTMPKPQRDDIIAVCTTGAYNYSMASNYNRIPRPPVIMIKDGRDYVAVRRESLEDLVRNDV